jgi:hypothetical protein
MSQASPTTRARARLGWSAWLTPALLLILAPPAAALLWGALARIAALLGYPYPHDGLEGTLLYEARLLRSGEPLYQPLDLHRFVSAPYPPLNYVAVALLDLYEGPHVFWSGRVVSLVAALVVAAAAAALIWRGSRSAPAAAIGATLLLSAPPVILWATRIKPDLLALAFTSLGLLLTSLVLTRAEGRGQGTEGQEAGAPHPSPRIPHPSLILAAACFALAFFTKQTAVAGPLAAGIALLAADVRDWLALRRASGRGASGEDRTADLRPQTSAQTAGSPQTHLRPSPFVFQLPIRTRTLAFTALYFALALGVWALLDLVTNRAYTLHVWWNFERVKWWSPGLFLRIIGLLGFWWPAMILAAAGVALAFRRRALFVPAAYALAAPISLVATGETGANHNHLLECHLALAILGAAALGCALRDATRRPLPALALAAITAAQLWLAFTPPAWYEDQLAPKDHPERFLVFMRSTPGEILADHTGLLFQAGKPLRYNDPSTMGPAARTGKWDQRGLLEDIANRRFSAIMIPTNAEKSLVDPSGRWTPEMLAAIREHYRLAFRDRIYTFVPR